MKYSWCQKCGFTVPASQLVCFAWCVSVMKLVFYTVTMDISCNFTNFELSLFATSLVDKWVDT